AADEQGRNDDELPLGVAWLHVPHLVWLRLSGAKWQALLRRFSRSSKGLLILWSWARNPLVLGSGRLREFHCGPSWQMSLTVPGGCALVTYYAPHSRTCPSRLPAPAVAPPASPVSHARRRLVLCHSPAYPRTTTFADDRGCLRPR